MTSHEDRSHWRRHCWFSGFQPSWSLFLSFWMWSECTNYRRPHSIDDNDSERNPILNKCRTDWLQYPRQGLIAVNESLHSQNRSGDSIKWWIIQQWWTGATENTYIKALNGQNGNIIYTLTYTHTIYFDANRISYSGQRTERQHMLICRLTFPTENVWKVPECIIGVKGDVRLSYCWDDLVQKGY